LVKEKLDAINMEIRHIQQEQSHAERVVEQLEYRGGAGMFDEAAMLPLSAVNLSARSTPSGSPQHDFLATKYNTVGGRREDLSQWSLQLPASTSSHMQQQHNLMLGGHLARSEHPQHVGMLQMEQLNDDYRAASRRSLRLDQMHATLQVW
jgi:hypothetical protein